MNKPPVWDVVGGTPDALVHAWRRGYFLDHGNELDKTHRPNSEMATFDLFAVEPFFDSLPLRETISSLSLQEHRPP